MAPLKVLLLSDGRPGHYHLAEGVLAAAARLRPVEIERVEIRRRRWAPGRSLAALARSRVSPKLLLRLGYGLKASQIPAADFIVSAGGDTLAANLAAARVLGVPNVFYGALRYFAPEDFALILNSHPRHAHRLRHVVTLKPSGADPDTMPALRNPARSGQGPSVAGLLIGGGTETIVYEPEDWALLVGFLKRLSTEHGTRWIVSNSRRTPRAASDAFSALAAEPEGPILAFIDVRTEGAGTLGDLFAKSEAILCTVDSSSMVSEAVWMRRPVIAIAPQASLLPPNEQEYRDHLEANGWARSVPIADLTPDRFIALLGSIQPIEKNPLDLLAATLKVKLPELFRD